MTEKNPDNPFPESDDNPNFEDVSSRDENEVTVILPEELTEDVGQEVTEEVPSPDGDTGKTGEVFVLLPDGDDSKIPMVETQEVTEEVDGPRLASVYESSTSSSELGLRSENPLHSDYVADTEIDPYGQPTEECMVTDQPTETMSAGDLDDFASEVADDMLASEGGASSMDHDPIGYEVESYDDDEDVYEEEAYTPRRSSKRRGSPFKKVVLSLAALVAISAAGVHFFPEHLGLDPSFDLPAFVMEHVNSLLGRAEVVTTDNGNPPVGGGDPGGGIDEGPKPPPLAMVAQETFKSKFKQAIELGFAGEVPR